MEKLEIEIRIAFLSIPSIGYHKDYDYQALGFLPHPPPLLGGSSIRTAVASLQGPLDAFKDGTEGGLNDRLLL